MASHHESQPHSLSQEQFLEQLQDVQERLVEKGIDYRIIGSIGAHALVPSDSLPPLNFDRSGAVLPYQRHPDIDIVVPRDALDEARSIRETKVASEFPVKLGLAASVSEINFRPEEEVSFLTHKNIAVAVSNHLLEARTAELDGVAVRTFSAPVLAQTFQTFGGIVRRKDMPQIRALIRADHASDDLSAFRQFRRLRRHASPYQAHFGKGLERFNEVSPPIIRNAVAAAAIKAADVLGKR